MDTNKNNNKTNETNETLSFELTGKGPLGRDEIKSLIESRSGEVKSISKNTNYLVTNEIDSQSSKMKKAKKLSISIITYDKLFEEAELEILQSINDKFKDFSTQEMIDLSHEEIGWQQNSDNPHRPIDYLYAFELKN